jgi:tetratricopeptide (TPR) repeat protein
LSKKKRFKIPFWLIASTLITATSAYADLQLREWRDQLDQAVFGGDGEQLESLAESFAAKPGNLAVYYQAYTNYRLGELRFEDKKLGKKYLNRCIDLLKPLVKKDPQFGEAHSLLATCYGVSAPFYMLRAATRGIAANSAQERAMQAAPDNPRVILADGISLYFRPSAFGGDKAKAAQRLREALQRFADFQPPGDDSPQWGEAEAWLYLGRIASDQGDPEAARAAYTQALQLAPAFGLAREELAGLDE